MIVYIIRHGQAENQSDSGRDADRNLTELGREQAGAISQYLARPDTQTPTRVFASPYTRTRQTAGAIWKALDHPEQIDDRLAATRSVSDLLSVIPDMDLPAIAMVSHNPIVSRAVDVLLAGPSAQHTCSMRPGQLIALRVDRPDLVGTAELVAQFRLGD